MEDIPDVPGKEPVHAGTTRVSGTAVAQDDREQRSLHLRRHDTGAGRGGGGGHRRGFDTFFAKTTAYMVSLKARVFSGLEDTGFVTGTYHLEPRGRKRSRQTGI